MNKIEIVTGAQDICEICELSKLKEAFETWKWNVLEAVKENQTLKDRCRMQLQVQENCLESDKMQIEKYRTCIEKTLAILENAENQSFNVKNCTALETIIDNFGLYITYMFRTKPENKATLCEEVLEKIEINNEYDVQHMMYAVLKALYPTARREVNQDNGYGANRFDIKIDEIDTVVEIKCTRDDHTEKRLYKELGEDAFFYKCSNLIIYVYDKKNVIKDVINFKKALSRDVKSAGKQVNVYIEQAKNII